MANLVTPMAVRVAATLRIADHIERELRTAPELAKAVNADAVTLERVLRPALNAADLPSAVIDGLVLLETQLTTLAHRLRGLPQGGTCCRRPSS